MVSPHSNWEDEENGYRSAGVGIFVEPTAVEAGREGSYRASGGVSPDDANAYSVDLRTGMGTEKRTWDPIATFDDPRTAWEFAHLLTHYFEACSSARAARDDLLGDDPGYSGDAEALPEPVAGMDAEAAFRRFVHPYSIPGRLRERLESGD